MEAPKSSSLKPFLANPCVFLKLELSESEDPNVWVIIFAHVDGIGAVSPNEIAIDAFRKCLE
jgi:hypothetical protein